MDSTRTYEEENARVNAFLFACYPIFGTVFNAALQLDLFGIIAKEGPDAYVSATYIASKLPTHNPEAPFMLDRMLRLLASHCVLSCSVRSLKDGGVERVYGLTPACKFYVSGSKDEDTLSHSAAYFHKLAGLGFGQNMKDAILEGGNAVEKVQGLSMYEYMKKDPELNTIFNKAMAGASTIITNAILEVYKGFEGLTCLVDVGGGTGKTLNTIISKYPSIKAINFDLPHVVQTAPQYPGIRHIGGDMFCECSKSRSNYDKDIASSGSHRPGLTDEPTNSSTETSRGSNHFDPTRDVLSKVTAAFEAPAS